jgi:hypothetical protein
MIPKNPEKWKPLFGKRSCSNKKLERDDDSKKSHPALGAPFAERLGLPENARPRRGDCGDLPAFAARAGRQSLTRVKIRG